MEFEGKRAIVTGGSRGIGKAIALELARAGADVAILAQNITKAEEIAAEISKMGRDSIAISVDVSDFSRVFESMQQIFDKWEKVDYLINNAGITRDALLLRLSPEDWNKVISVNLTGVYNCTKAVLKEMIQVRSGKIVNITSINAVTGSPGQTNYAASKAGIIGFTKSCAKEIASRGISVNAVAPGFIETDMTADLSDKVRSEVLKRIPMKRFGTSEDVAKVVSFLLGSGGSYITGQVLHVNGGMYM